MAKRNFFDVVNSVILKIPTALKFPADDLQFPIICHSTIMSNLITLVIAY